MLATAGAQEATYTSVRLKTAASRAHRSRPAAVQVYSAYKVDRTQTDCTQQRWIQRLITTAAACVVASSPIVCPPVTHAEENQVPVAAVDVTKLGSKEVFINVKVENEKIGRITIALYDDVAIGSQRFADLAKGKQGVSYKLSKFDALTPSYIRNAGVKSLSYAEKMVTPITGGATTDLLEEELAQQTRGHDSAGVVSLVVTSTEERDVKEKLVAYQGKLVTVQETAGELPNGTAFTITTAPAPELDATNLVVGKVVGGFDVVESISQLPKVKDNTGSPFYQAGRTFGDKRAVVAGKSFNRPFARVIIDKAGLLE